MAKAADHLWDLSQDEILQEIAFKERLNEMERQAIEKERQEAEKERQQAEEKKRQAEEKKRQAEEKKRQAEEKEAREKAVKQAVEQGMEQGMKQKQKEFVLKLIERKMKLQEICEITGLSEAEVQKMSK